MGSHNQRTPGLREEDTRRITKKVEGIIYQVKGVLSALKDALYSRSRGLKAFHFHPWSFIHGAQAVQ